jgi:hypothetical protein
MLGFGDLGAQVFGARWAYFSVVPTWLRIFEMPPALRETTMALSAIVFSVSLHAF